MWSNLQVAALMQAKEKRGHNLIHPPGASHRQTSSRRIRKTALRCARHRARGLKRTWRTALLLILTSTFMVSGITSCGSSHTSKWWQTCQVTKAPPGAGHIEVTDHLVVYLDISESMKGFVARRQATEAASAQTVFSKALLELRNVVTTMTPQPKLVLRVIDEEVRPPADAFQLAEYAVNRDWFDRSETNLAGAVHAFGTGIEKMKPTDAAAAPARFHILVTDAVQSIKATRSDIRCLQGSDPHCVKERINELLNQGWSGTILGVRSDFDGEVFSESRPHLSVKYRSEPGKTETFRPFYFYLFSPDEAGLEKLVANLKDALRVLLKADQLREYPLTAQYFSGAANGDLIALNQEEFTVTKEKTPSTEALCFNVKVALPSGRRTATALSADSLTTQTAPLHLTLTVPWSRHALDSGTKQEIAGLLKWELLPVAFNPEEGARYPQMRIVSSTANPDGSVTLQLMAKWDEGVGKRRALIYRLVGRIDLDKAAPPWVAQWSTDTDISEEEATRTLNLKASLANLWNNQFLQRQEIAAACLRVGDF